MAFCIFLKVEKGVSKASSLLSPAKGFAYYTDLMRKLSYVNPI